MKKQTTQKERRVPRIIAWLGSGGGTYLAMLGLSALGIEPTPEAVGLTAMVIIAIAGRIVSAFGSKLSAPPAAIVLLLLLPLMGGCYLARYAALGPPPAEPPSAETDVMARAVQYYPDGKLKSETFANRKGFSNPVCPADEPCEVKLKTNHEGAGLDVTYKFQGVETSLQERQQAFNNQYTADQTAAYREDLRQVQARIDGITRALLAAYGGALPANIAGAILGMPVGPATEGLPVPK